MLDDMTDGALRLATPPEATSTSYPPVAASEAVPDAAPVEAVAEVTASRPRTAAERAAEAALRPVAGVEELQVVGAIHDRVLDQLGILTSARSVWLHPDVVKRVGRRRAGADVEFVLAHMARTILRPELVAHGGPSDRRAEVIYLVSGHEPDSRERHLCVAVKLVTGPGSLSGLDELWVSTAFPLGRRSLTRLERRGRLSAVEWKADD